MSSTPVNSAPPSGEELDHLAFIQRWYDVQYFISVFILLPICFPMGYFGNIISSVVLRRKARENSAFLYQLGLITLDLISMVTGSCYAFVKIVGTHQTGTESLSVRRFYPLMFYSAHMNTQIVNMQLTSNTLYLTTVSFDRLYALLRPQKYYTLDHKKRTILLLVACYTLGVLTSLHDVLRFRIKYLEEHGAYEIYTDYVFAHSTIPQSMALLRTALRFGATISMAICALWTSRLYTRLMRERRQKIAAMRLNANDTNVVMPVQEQTLTRLLIGQVLLVIIGYSMVYFFYGVVYFGDTNFWKKYYGLLGLYGDFTSVFAYCGNFLCYMMISRDFRKDVLVLLRCSNVVQPQNTAPHAVDENAARFAFGVDSVAANAVNSHWNRA